MPRVTIRTIAEATGLSVSTVSRALESKGRVSPDTRELVARVSREMGYRPNAAAKALVSGRTRTLGLVVPNITNPFFAGLLKGAQARARDLGYIILLADTDEDYHVEQELIAEMSVKVEGLILAVTPSAHATADVEDYAARLPIVLINREREGTSSARPEVEIGMRQALEHLAALGHKHICYVSTGDDSWMNHYRHDTAEAESTRIGLQLTVTGPYPPSAEGGAASLEPVLASGATAAICFNDLMALGLISQLSNRGMSCPADLSVIGIDDILYSAISIPPLTTIRVAPQRIGKAATDLLVAQIDRPEAEIQQLKFPSDLVVRRSTGPVPRG